MNKTELVDTHCHLYLKEFREDLDNVMLRAHQEGVSRMYMPSIDSSYVDEMKALEEKFPGKCFSMMGLHPCSVNENYEEELRSVENWLNARAFAAVGEIGLDYYWERKFENEQKIAFARQINLAHQNNLPVVIHSRSSMDDCIDTIKKHQDGSLQGIFHCFSGDARNAADIIDMGFYLGIGGVITYKNSGLAEVIVSVPLENIVLETDAPYLSPVPFRGKRNESGYIRYVVKKLAEVKGVSEEEVAAITTANAEKLFGI